jgi:site-specific DNA-methyltransferase (adenine-specific)
MSLYYQDDFVTLYHGDCLTEHREWLDADVLITDPPYGMGYDLHSRARIRGEISVANDHDTTARDDALTAWGSKPAMVFGSWRNERPKCDQMLIWDKGDEAALGHPVFFSAFEEIYIMGTGWAGPRRSNVIRVKGMSRGGQERKDYAHPTPKPVGLMETLVAHAAQGVIADPFAGSGATLVAAKNLRKKAVGIELEERHCETIVKRLLQDVLELEWTA